jgi:hypothetical protein
MVRKWVYRFSVCSVLWPVMLATFITVSPNSNNTHALDCLGVARKMANQWPSSIDLGHLCFYP